MTDDHGPADHGPADAGPADDVPTDDSAAGEALVDVADLAADLAELRDLVADLSEAFAALLHKEEQREGPSRWSWRHADAPTAATLWSELIDFVDWLVVRYQLTSEHSTVPPCWYRHPVAVEEFTAVMAAWQGAYSGPDSPRDDLIAPRQVVVAVPGPARDAGQLAQLHRQQAAPTHDVARLAARRGSDTVPGR